MPLPSSYTDLTWYGRAELMIYGPIHTATAKRCYRDWVGNPPLGIIELTNNSCLFCADLDVFSVSQSPLGLHLRGLGTQSKEVISQVQQYIVEHIYYQIRHSNPSYYLLKQVQARTWRTSPLLAQAVGTRCSILRLESTFIRLSRSAS